MWERQATKGIDMNILVLDKEERKWGEEGGTHVD